MCTNSLKNKTAIVKYESKEVHIDVLADKSRDIVVGFRGTTKISSDHNSTHLYYLLLLIV